MARQDQFPQIFDRLRSVLRPFAEQLTLRTDEAENYALHTVALAEYPQYPDGMLFASVQVKKSYVSYHLMPVYAFPDLLDGMPELLRKRMQGKSCFNFSKLDEERIAELERLTTAGFERFRRERLVPE